MGRKRRTSRVFLLLLGLLCGDFATCWAQSAPGQRPANPRSTNPRVTPQGQSPRRTPQPRVMTRPQPRQAPRAEGAPVQPGAAMPPGFPLDAQQQARVDQILKYWEHHTAKIKTYECKFVRQNFDFVFGQKETPKSVDYGTIRYKAPDKGLMRVDEVYNVNPQATDSKQKYVKQDVKYGEYWVCDGESIYQFEARTKVLTETKLPPQLQGQAIADGPLPFLFGAKAASMQERYWIREVTPKDNPEGEYFLEATPKRQEDAANFDRLLVQLKIDKGQLFPRAMRAYNKQGYVQYEFKDHSPNNPLHRVQGFLDSFVRPTTPVGWTKVVEDWGGQRADELQAAKDAPGAKPTSGPNRR